MGKNKFLHNKKYVKELDKVHNDRSFLMNIDNQYVLGLVFTMDRRPVHLVYYNGHLLTKAIRCWQQNRVVFHHRINN